MIFAEGSPESSSYVASNLFFRTKLAEQTAKKACGRSLFYFPSPIMARAASLMMISLVH